MATKMINGGNKVTIKGTLIVSNEMNLRNPRATGRGTQLNAAHAQLLEKLRPIAFAETCRFLTIQSLEFQEIWPKNSLETA